MKALIDGDIILHSCTQGRDDEEEYHTFGAAKRMIHNVLDEVETDKYDLILSGSWETNFRYKVFPQYKANRNPERPKHYEALRRYLLDRWGGRVVEGEADDHLGIVGYSTYEQAIRDATFDGLDPSTTSDVVICTIDKDLNMIPGWHYNWKRGETYWQTEYQAWYCFFTQLLTGDSVDGIPGLPKVGPKTAEKILKATASPKQMAEVCQEEYIKREFGDEYLWQMADLIWILREEGVRGRQILKRLT